jgi:hypothetical protein
MYIEPYKQTRTHDMTQYIEVTKDDTKEVVKTIDLTGSPYRRALKVMDGLERNMNHYEYTATLHGYEQEEVNQYDVAGLE